MARPRTGTLSLRKRGGRMVWCAQITVTGEDGTKKRPLYSLETEDKALAKKKLKKLIASLATSEPEAPKPRVAGNTVALYSEVWLERRAADGVADVNNERQRLRDYILPHIGDLDLEDVQPAHIKNALEAAVEKVDRSTVVKIRGVALRMFQAARCDMPKVVTSNPVELTTVPGKKTEKKERAIVTDNEFAIYLSHPDADLEVKMLSVYSRTIGGMRTGDLNKWAWSMVDVSNFESVIVPRSKTKKPQTIEVPIEVRPHLRAWWERQGKPSGRTPIFPARRGDNAGGFKKERGNSYAKRFRRDLKRALDAHREKVAKECDVPIEQVPPPRRELFNETDETLPVDFHSFRRAYCTALAESGINAQHAVHLAGHGDIKTHLGYVAKTKALGVAPSQAIPQLPVAITSEESRFSARHRGFEPLTFGSGERRSDEKPASNKVVSRSEQVKQNAEFSGLTRPVGCESQRNRNDYLEGAVDVW